MRTVAVAVHEERVAAAQGQEQGAAAALEGAVASKRRKELHRQRGSSRAGQPPRVAGITHERWFAVPRYDGPDPVPDLAQSQGDFFRSVFDPPLKQEGIREGIRDVGGVRPRQHPVSAVGFVPARPSEPQRSPHQKMEGSHQRVILPLSLSLSNLAPHHHLGPRLRAVQLAALACARRRGDRRPRARGARGARGRGCAPARGRARNRAGSRRPFPFEHLTLSSSPGSTSRSDGRLAAGPSRRCTPGTCGARRWPRCCCRYVWL